MDNLSRAAGEVGRDSGREGVRCFSLRCDTEIRFTLSLAYGSTFYGFRFAKGLCWDFLGFHWCVISGCSVSFLESFSLVLTMVRSADGPGTDLEVARRFDCSQASCLPASRFWRPRDARRDHLLSVSVPKFALGPDNLMPRSLSDGGEIQRRETLLSNEFPQGNPGRDTVPATGRSLGLLLKSIRWGNIPSWSLVSIVNLASFCFCLKFCFGHAAASAGGVGGSFSARW